MPQNPTEVKISDRCEKINFEGI
jgi:hypothetical protein